MDVKLRSKMSHWPEISRRFVLYRNSLVFDFEGIKPLKIVIKFFCGIFSLVRIFHFLTLDLTFVKNWKKHLCVLTIFPPLSINFFFSAYSTKLVSVKNLKMSLHLLPFCLRTFLLQVVLSSNVKPLHLFCQPHLWSCPIWSQLFLKRILRNFWIHCQRYALVLNP